MTDHNTDLGDESTDKHVGTSHGTDADSAGAETGQERADDEVAMDGGGAATETTGAGTETAAYLDEEIHLFRPATPFMRDHLKVVWGTFIAWVLIVFGPTTVALFAPEAADAHRIAGAPTLFMVTAIGTPLSALLLSAVYAYQRDKLDERYGISHGQPEPDEAPATADGGQPQGGED